jgi:cytoskeletal protein RodZ
MSELGQWLRETRQAKDLTLEQVEAETRIRAKFLAALEEDNHEALPDDISAKGFLRNYALFLNLDPDEALSKFGGRHESPRGSETSLFRPLEVTLFEPAAGSLRGRLFLLVLIVGVVAAGLWAWRTGRMAWPPPLAIFQPAATATPSPTAGSTRPPRPSHTATPSSATTPAPTRTFPPSATPRPSATNQLLVRPTATSSPTPTATATRPTHTPTSEDGPTSPTPTATLTTTLQANVTLSIAVNRESWVEVTVDGRNVLRELWQPGAEGTWQAQREIILRLGNAGGVDVTVNGEALSPLGESQQVVEFAWGPGGEITPAPTFTPTSTPQATPEAQETPTP